MIYSPTENPRARDRYDSADSGRTLGFQFSSRSVRRLRGGHGRLSLESAAPRTLSSPSSGGRARPIARVASSAAVAAVPPVRPRGRFRLRARASSAGSGSARGLVRGRGAAAGTPPGIARRREEQIARRRRANRRARRRRTRGKRWTLRRVRGVRRVGGMRRVGRLRVGRLRRPDDDGDAGPAGSDGPEIPGASPAPAAPPPASARRARPRDPARASTARRSHPATTASSRAGTEPRSSRKSPRGVRRSPAFVRRGGGGVAVLPRDAVDGLALVLAGGRRGRGGRRATLFRHRRKIEVRRLGEDIVHRVVVVVGGEDVAALSRVSVVRVVFFFVVSVLVPVRSSRLGVRHVRGFDLAGILSAFFGRAPRLFARRRVAFSVVSVAFSSVAVDARDAVHGSALAVARVVAEVFADVAVARLGVCSGLGLGVELGDDEGEVLAEGIGVDGVIFGVVRGGGEPARDELLREDRGRVRELLLVEEHGKHVEDVLGGVPRKKEPRLRERHGGRARSARADAKGDDRERDAQRASPPARTTGQTALGVGGIAPRRART